MVTMECNECGNRFRVNQDDIFQGDIVCPLCFSDEYDEVGGSWNEDLQPGDYGCTGYFDESEEWIGCDGNTWSE